MDIPLINGTRHDWASIEVNILGRTLTGISGISYGWKHEKTNNYGKGYYPVSRGRKNYEASCKLTMAKYELDAIEALLPAGKSITDITPFDITISYLPTGQDRIKREVVRNCEFTDRMVDVKQGDDKIEMEMELITSDIKTGR